MQHAGRKNIISAMLLVLLTVCAYFRYEGQGEPQGLPKDIPGRVVWQQATEQPKAMGALQALSAVILDGTNGRVLYGKDETKHRAMASTTKIMTCLLALESQKWSEEVTVSSYAASQPDVQLNIRAGERYRLGDLVYSMMLESHNDSAVAVAEHIAGSCEEFAVLMNQRAEQLGMRDTHFVTPNGLDAKGHYSTAKDMALLAAYAMQNDAFRAIVKTPSRQIASVDGKRAFYLRNIDKYLYLDRDAAGIKTGFTGEAGYCFVGATWYEGHCLISVVLGSGWPPNRSYKWKDTAALVAYVRDQFHEETIRVEAKRLGPVRVLHGTKPVTELLIAEAFEEQLLLGGEEVWLEYRVPKELSAPLQKGQVVGSLVVGIGAEPYRFVPVVAAQSVPLYTYRHCFREILKIFFGKM